MNNVKWGIKGKAQLNLSTGAELTYWSCSISLKGTLIRSRPWTVHARVFNLVVGAGEYVALGDDYAP